MSHTNIVTIGIDLGKNTFHVVGFDATGAIILRKKRSRNQLEQSLANIPPCLIGMEACAAAHYVGRKLEKIRPSVRLLPAQYVKPYLKGHKNDFRDAEAIAEAVQRPTMRFVPLKSPEQLDLQALHRVRSRLILSMLSDNRSPRVVRLIQDLAEDWRSRPAGRGNREGYQRARRSRCTLSPPDECAGRRPDHLKRDGRRDRNW
jgi:transposase